MRQKRLCGITVPVWADLRGRDGAVTNIRFRVAAHPDAEKLPSDAPERRLAAALEWHGWECYSRHVICRLLGCQPLLVASDDELMAILDVNPTTRGCRLGTDLPSANGTHVCTRAIIGR